jgi:hypothetical protein
MYRLQLKELKERKNQDLEKWQLTRSEAPSKEGQDARMQKTYGKTR